MVNGSVGGNDILIGMKTVAIVMGCCFLALITSVAFLSEINTPTPTPPTPYLVATVTPPIVEQTTPVPPTPNNQPFTVPITYEVGATNIYPDGSMITLQAISDSRCKPEVQCIWAGELAPEFLIQTKTGTTSDTVVLGSVRTTKFQTSDYTFTLVNTSENEATIIITPISTPVVTIATTTATTVPNATKAPLTTKTTVKPSTTKIVRATSATAPTADFKQALISEIEKQTNEFRKRNKRSPLSIDTALARNATQYSAYLFTHSFLSHTDKKGCDISCRFLNKGYEADAWGENLAMMTYEEQPSVEYIANYFMTQWQKSAGHRKNLLSTAFTHQGIGVTFDDTNIYMVVHFAHPQ